MENAIRLGALAIVPLETYLKKIMTRKGDRRHVRSKDTIKTEGLKPWKASDSTTGVTRRTFPTFRVNEDDLNAINEYCETEGIERSVLMRRLIAEFIQSINKQQEDDHGT